MSAAIALLVASAPRPARADGGVGGSAFGDGGAGGVDSTTGTGGTGGVPSDTFTGGGGGGAGTTQGGDGGEAIGVGGGAGGPGGTGVGGNGGGGGNGTVGDHGGGGGGGGTAGLVSAGTTTSTAVSGGTGGAGGSGFAAGAGSGGGGGAGGYGAIISSGTFTITGTGSATGGTGGAGGNGGGGGGDVGGNGGSGGIGVAFSGGGALSNSGTITGGTGGAGGTGVLGNGIAGLGGAGIAGAGLSITNSGSISGGLGGDGVTRANAITFTGGTNSLTLQSGSTITGNVVGTGSDTLALGGSTNATFDTSKIGAAAQYQGFGTFQKTGTSTWTLSNTTAATTAWKISQGTLSISSDTNLGAAAGGVTLDGGALAVTAGVTSARGVTITSNNGTIATGGNPVSLSGTIGGTGALTETGGGFLNLSGNNTYSGGTTISGSTLAVAVDTVGTPGAITSSAIGTGTLTFDGGTLENFGTNFTIANAGKVNNTGGTIDAGGSSFTYSGAIADGDGTSGTLHIIDSSAGGDTVSFSGANIYGAATVIGDGTTNNAATLEGGATNSFSANSAVTVTANSGLDLGGFNQSIGSLAGAGNVTNSGSSNATLTAGGDNTSTTFSGVMSDGAHTVALTKAGTGTFILTGANTYTGGTTVNAGTLQLGAGGSLAATGGLAVNGGIFDLNGHTQTVGKLSGTGGTISLASGALTGGDNTNTILAAAITGTGSFIKQGTGTLILNAVNTYSGGTTINAGTLEVGDASHTSASLAGNVTIGAGGSLMGHGTIGGGVTNTAGGTLAPGGSIGTLSVASYTQGSTSTLQIEVSPTAASKLLVAGAASLNGALSLVYDPGVYSATTYGIVHAGSVTGTFATVSSSGSVPTNVSSSIAYSGTDVDLVLAGPASTTLVVRPTNDTVYSSLNTSALFGGQQANDLLLGHLAGAHSGTGSDTIETALAGTSPTQLAFSGGAMHLSDAVAQLPDAMAQMGGWFRATGTFASLSSSSVPGVDTQGGGFMAGLDRPIAPNLTAGLAAGYSHTNLSQHDSECGTLDTPRVAAYGSYTMGPWAFDATAGYAYDHISAKRPLIGIGTASSTHDAQEATGAAQATYRFDYAGFSVMPNAGVTYVHLFEDGSDESGAGGFDLDVSHRNSDSLRPFVGISASTPITTASGMRLVPEGDVRYSHELFATAPSVVSVGGGNFSVNGITPSHDLLTVGGGVTAAMSDRLALFADYHATVPTGNYWQQTISAGARYKF